MCYRKLEKISITCYTHIIVQPIVRTLEFTIVGVDLAKNSHCFGLSLADRSLQFFAIYSQSIASTIRNKHSIER